MDNIFISPSFRPDKLASGKLEDKIEVFEDRMTIPIIEQAAALFKAGRQDRLAPHAGIAVLIILLPYFETIAQYRNGRDSKGQSEKFFIEEFLRVFKFEAEEGAPSPTLDQKEAAARAVYKEVRCGLIHAWSQRSKVVLSDQYKAAVRIGFDQTGVSQIEIHPEVFLDRVKYEFFPKFMEELRNPSNIDLRANFEKFFDAV